MHTSNTIKVDGGNMGRDTRPSAEILELVRTQLGRPLEQEPFIDHNLAGLVVEVANRVAIEYGRYLRHFFIRPE